MSEINFQLPTFNFHASHNNRAIYITMKYERLYGKMNFIVVISYIIPYMFTSCSAGTFIHSRENDFQSGCLLENFEFVPCSTESNVHSSRAALEATQSSAC